jgi:hypothetical protein
VNDSQRVAALIFNGVSKGVPRFMLLSEREAIANSVYDELVAGGIEIRVAGPEHDYLSTACLHGEHGYCQGTEGQAGPKTPGKCKFCDAACRCACHQGGEG